MIRSQMPTAKKVTEIKPKTVKVTKKVVAKVVEAPKAVATAKKVVAGGLNVPVYSLLGVSTSFIELPKDLFGGLVNKGLLALAMRVYLNNQKMHWGNTKTRGEVDGSTRKIYKQKGTGGARHGSNRAPIFRGGGITFGPKIRNTILKLPQKMKAAALLSALSMKAADGQIKILDSARATGKTKEMVKFVQGADLRSALIVTSESTSDESKLINRSATNLQRLDTISVTNLNAYDVLKVRDLVFTKSAIPALQDRFAKNVEVENA